MYAGEATIHDESNTDSQNEPHGGHGSGATDGQGDSEQAEGQASDVGGVAGKRLQSFIERVERLEEEKAALAEDIKEVYSEAKATGFDVKTIRQIIKLRKMDIEKRRENDELLELYMAAIGMDSFSNTPLGSAL